MTRLELQQQFLELQRDFKKTSIFVTHDVREAMRLGSRIALLVRGTVEIDAQIQPSFNSAQSGEARAFLACL